MKIAVISDDLTGANDCGGQLIDYGLDVSVILKWDRCSLDKKDVVIYNTNSRDLASNEAYDRVRDVSKHLKEKSFDLVYKKIDSTMRGNIGDEINAMYDVFQTDFVIIAPAYPQNGRQVIDGTYYLNNKKLSETEVAKDPKTPVKTSFIKNIIEDQSHKKVGHILYSDLGRGYEYILKCLKSFKKQGIYYITVDTVCESDFTKLVNFIKKTEFSVIWCGSAGLMEYLPQAYEIKKIKENVRLSQNKDTVLLVVGSVSKSSRKQLDKLLSDTNTVGIEMKSTKVILDGDERKKELNHIFLEAQNAIKCNKNLALFSSSEVEKTQDIGMKHGYTAIEISNTISRLLGEVSVNIINNFKVKNLFLTGGDIAYQVFNKLDANEFHLLSKIEPGIPLGELNDGRKILAVTKAGSFGSELIMSKAISALQGGNE
ncbi:four-carbon acid sugar kinase family protein [Clostridium sp. 001]|uniref:four-carbon acid sugar kinase family protein n=1 Tax=Clostridium sp. 001 TaxID=1970093 RepID=UPI001C2C0C81|nr:four-carbon acid sugar kinase family protein [Clostridium sp. 001]QXE17865.1 hypothetical protein B5S50_02820 [Clostridium sp. 001]